MPRQIPSYQTSTSRGDRNNPGTVSAAWRALSRSPRKLWVACSRCRYSSINEDKALKGWQETVSLPRRYRCSDCSEVDR